MDVFMTFRHALRLSVPGAADGAAAHLPAPTGPSRECPALPRPVSMARLQTFPKTGPWSYASPVRGPATDPATRWQTVLDRVPPLHGRPRDVEELSGGLTNINLKVRYDD